MAHAKLTRLFFWACGIAQLAIILLALQRRGLRANPVEIALLGFGAIACFSCLRLKPSNRAAAALCVFWLVIAAVIADVYISHFVPITWRDRLVHGWRSNGKPYDERSQSQLIADLRAEGIDAYPAAIPRVWLGPSHRRGRKSVIALNGREVLPLGGGVRRRVGPLQRIR